MNNKQGKVSMSFLRKMLGLQVFFIGMSLLVHISVVKAQDIALQSVDFNALSGDNLQLSFDFSNEAVPPKVFTMLAGLQVLLLLKLLVV